MTSILKILLERIDAKTTWGKNELKFLILEIIAERNLLREP